MGTLGSTGAETVALRDSAAAGSKAAGRGRVAPSFAASDFRSTTETDGPVESLSRSLLVHGRASAALDLVPAGSVRTVVTSPPYWSLRDYEVDRQIGRDDSLDDYVAGIVDTFAKVRRVLTEDGTVWLNVGDSYTSGNRGYRAPDRKNRARAMAMRPRTPKGSSRRT